MKTAHGTGDISQRITAQVTVRRLIGCQAYAQPVQDD
jgi:hypothetical protein